ncbi:MAG: zinc-dependent metalloprotease [Candidatus Bathyarchaeota archaeon]|nr:zinc-dependent metalloprotease [Candidatus Bathyarchaeota archaeon]
MGDEEKQSISISEKTDGMEKHVGYFTFYWDDSEGKIWLEIKRFDEEFIYVDGLTAGVGSNDIGLDRNQLGKTRIVKFQRVGPKVLLTQVNYGYRAVSDDVYERKAVEDAFAQSIHWGFKVEAEEDGKVLVDATEFLMRDSKNVVSRLQDKEQGDYELDESRSAIYLPRTKSFPRNTEFEATLTFTGKNPGEWVKSVVPDPMIITVRQHHSFIQLPEDGYTPRKYDLRASYFGVKYMDYATQVEDQIEKRYIARHRLNKKKPNSKTSKPVKPIVYYVDRAIPEPIRSAVLEGANWWNLAFEAAGYKDAYLVELLPEDADPMDIRYNVINWVHRSTRGWSYGVTVTDPRTGEILKGHVSLGSLRIRQDFLIAQGLVANYDKDNPDSTKMLEMALARIRQLSVHEVGHTLGLGHNYCSHINGRASVMDYPAPLVKIGKNGEIDLSEAYETGIGKWDKVSIAYGYQDFPEGMDEEEELEKILVNAFKSGLLFAPSQDAGYSSASPNAASWVNGKDPVDELDRMMKVREVALKSFSERRIKTGEPLAKLEEVLVPLYLFHRFQVESTASMVGGLYYNYTVRGDVQGNPEIVPGDEQRRALQALLRTITPEALAIDEKLLRLIPPRPQGYPQTRDLFPGYTGHPFDPLGAAETAANHTVGMLLHPQRASRLMEYHARNSDAPGLGEIIDKLTEATWKTSTENGFHGEVQRTVNDVVLYNLITLVKNDEASPRVRATTSLKLVELGKWMKEEGEHVQDTNQRAHLLYFAAQIKLFKDNPDQVKLTKPRTIPMGPPI